MSQSRLSLSGTPCISKFLPTPIYVSSSHLIRKYVICEGETAAKQSENHYVSDPEHGCWIPGILTTRQDNSVQTISGYRSTLHIGVLEPNGSVEEGCTGWGVQYVSIL